MSTIPGRVDHATYTRLMADYDEQAGAFRAQRERLFGENPGAKYKLATEVGGWLVLSNTMMVFFKLNLSGSFPPLPARHYELSCRVVAGFNAHNTFSSFAESHIRHAPDQGGTRDNISTMDLNDPIMLREGLVIGDVFQYPRADQHTIDVIRGLSGLLATIETV